MLHPKIATAWGASGQEMERNRRRTLSADDQNHPKDDQEDRKQQGDISRTRMVGGPQGEHPPFPDNKQTHQDKERPAQPVDCEDPRPAGRASR